MCYTVVSKISFVSLVGRVGRPALSAFLLILRQDKERVFMAEKEKIKGKNTVAVVWNIVEPIAESLGLVLWDIRFVKEGASWFLRLFIDKEGGVTMDDCVDLSHAVDQPLDEADPIEQSYYMEVSSPGLERQLTRDFHFDICKGKPVVVHLIRPCEQQRDFSGILEGLQDKKVIIKNAEGKQLSFKKEEIASVRLDDNDFGGQE